MPEFADLQGRLAQPRKRGQPLVIFLSVLMVWMGVRTLTWQHLSLAIHDSKPSLKAPIRPRISLKRWQNAQNTSLIGHAAPIADVPWHPAPSPLPMALPQVPLPQPQALDLIDPMTEVTSSARVRGAAAQQMLYLAVMAQLPSPFDMPPERNEAKKAPSVVKRPPSVLRLSANGGPVSKYAAMVPPRTQDLLALGQRQTLLAPRWSGDGWLLMRQGGASNALSSGGAPYGPTYGANQIGAVLRYRLVPGSPFKLTAYTRAYGALNGTGEKEVAAGLSLRPVPSVPIIAMAEMRASQFQSGQTHLRPSVSLVTEMPPVALGGKVEAETYVQAGYVGGLAATPFIDGQIRVEHVVNRPDGAQVRLGVGAWGGAQYGANRLDVGPTLRVGLHSGRVGGRLAIDYRLRVKGNAMPSSGPAVTLSAGF